MSTSKKQERADRRAKIEAVQAQYKAEERRRKVLLYGIVAVILISIAGWTTLVLGNENQKNAALTAAAEKPITGVQEYGELSRNHVEAPATYKQTPGVGGDHSRTWTNCGIYTEPVDETRAVHSLEHGAVWITYRPDLPKDQVQQLTNLVDGRSFTLLSPNGSQKAPITASAWGTQLEVRDATDERIATFLKKYIQGPQTPEPGAACTGGISG